MSSEIWEENYQYCMNCDIEIIRIASQEIYNLKQKFDNQEISVTDFYLETDNITKNTFSKPVPNGKLHDPIALENVTDLFIKILCHVKNISYTSKIEALMKIQEEYKKIN